MRNIGKNLRTVNKVIDADVRRLNGREKHGVLNSVLIFDSESYFYQNIFEFDDGILVDTLVPIDVEKIDSKIIAVKIAEMNKNLIWGLSDTRKAPYISAVSSETAIVRVFRNAISNIC